ncbi:MAG TPA: aldehyde dehydrogenase family protein [Allosphingosinicella sp.]
MSGIATVDPATTAGASAAMPSFLTLFDGQKSWFASDATKSYAWRVEQLGAMARMLSDNRARFYEAAKSDFKTAVQEHVFEVEATIATIEATIAQLADWMRPLDSPIPRFLAESGHKGVVYREPYGVTLILCPSNGPLTLSLRPAAAALAAGNPCILKLSDLLPATNAALLELIPRYFDGRAFAAVTGRREQVAEMLKLPWDFIFLTGSVAAGKAVMRAAAENLTPVLLELGGQNPAIVDMSANIPDAARKLVWGATAWGGQWCTSPGYAAVHEEVADAFVSECANALVEFYGDEPRGNPDLSRIIDPAAVGRLAALLDPEKIVAGGRFDEAASYFDPTILYPVSWSDRIMQEEIFGPVLPILRYSDLEQLLARIKSMPRPLAAYIFSRDQAAIDRFVSSLSFGGGAVNQTNVFLFVETMPFGGVGHSGIGHYYGKHGFDALTHAKSMLISPPDTAIEHLFPPFSEEKVREIALWTVY